MGTVTAADKKDVFDRTALDGGYDLSAWDKTAPCAKPVVTI